MYSSEYLSNTVHISKLHLKVAWMAPEVTERCKESMCPYFGQWLRENHLLEGANVGSLKTSSVLHRDILYNPSR